MYINDYLLSDDVTNKLHSANRSLLTVSNTTGTLATSIEFSRFEEKKESYAWANPDEIYFALSADHYVKTLVNCDKKMKWMTRHSTLKELIDILPAGNFIRLNKFYLLNLNYFSRINEGEKLRKEAILNR